MDESGNYGYIKDGADTVTPFKIYGEVKVTTPELTSKILTFNTQKTGFNKFIAMITPQLALITIGGNVWYYGFNIYFEYNKNTGEISAKINDPGNAIISIAKGTYILKYVLWND